MEGLSYAENESDLNHILPLPIAELLSNTCQVSVIESPEELATVHDNISVQYPSKIQIPPPGGLPQSNARGVEVVGTVVVIREPSSQGDC